MIQFQFSSFNNIPKPFPPIAPTSAASSSANIPTVPLLKLNNHRRKGQFTEKIVRHGGVMRDSSLSAASKLKQRQQKHYEKAFGTLEEMMEEFEKEKNEILNQKQLIIKNQQVLANKLLKWYAALTIQMSWRCFRAIRMLKRLKAARFLSLWASWRHYYRRLCHAASVINRRVKTLMARRRYLKFIKFHRAAKIIQRNFRKRLDWYRWLFHIFRLSRIKRFIDHILLFGRTRATRILLEGTKKQQEIRVVGRFFIRSCARKRRMKMLKSPQGKIAFYVLSRFYVSNSSIPHNKVMEYLRKRVLEKEDKSKRRVNLSMKQATDLNMKSKASGRNKNQTSPKQVHSPYASQQQREQQQQQLQQQQQQEQFYQSQAALFTIHDLPPFFHGVFAPRTVADVMMLIQDLYQVAIQNPSYLDDSIVPTHPSTTQSGLSTASSTKRSYNNRNRGEGQNPKHAPTLTAATSTAAIPAGGKGKVPRTTSTEEYGDNTPKSASSVTSSTSSTSTRHATSYAASTSGGGNARSKFMKKDTFVGNHGTSNPSDFSPALGSFTPAPPNSARATEIGKSPRTRFTGVSQARGPPSRGSEALKSIIVEIAEDNEEDESPKSVKKVESLNTDTSGDDDDHRRGLALASDSASSKDLFDSEKPLPGKSFQAKLGRDLTGGTPLATPRTTAMENSKGNNTATARRPSKITPSSARPSVNHQPTSHAIRSTVTHQKEGTPTTTTTSSSSNLQKRMSKANNSITSSPSIGSAPPPLVVLKPIHEEEQLQFPAISTPDIKPIHHPSEVIIPKNEAENDANNETVSLALNNSGPFGLKTLSSTMSSTLIYSESEDESTPFKDMKGKKLSNSSLPPPNALFSATTSTLPPEDSTGEAKEQNLSPGRDDFISGVVSPLGESLLKFEIPENTMVELLGTGFDLDGNSK